MALLKFFKWVKSEKELVKEQVENDLRDTLPDPIEPLSTSSIVAANEEVRKVYEQSATGERGLYVKLTALQRLEIEIHLGTWPTITSSFFTATAKVS